MPGSEDPAILTADIQPSSSLEKKVLRILETANPKTVQEVVDTIRSEEPLLTEEIKEITEILRRLDERGKIQLIDLSIDQPARGEAYGQNSGIRQDNKWLYVVLTLVVGTFAAVYALPPGNAHVPIRWVLASLLAIFLPGYTTVQALFPAKTLDYTERFAFSVGLSFALLGLVGLILNYTPWGLEVAPIVASLFLYTVSLALIAFYRRRRYSRQQ